MLWEIGWLYGLLILEVISYSGAASAAYPLPSRAFMAVSSLGGEEGAEARPLKSTRWIRVRLPRAISRPLSIEGEAGSHAVTGQALWQSFDVRKNTNSHVV